MKFNRNKYKVSPPDQRTYKGKLYASKAEMEYAAILWTLYDADKIKILIEQPRLWLGVRENVYVPDFFVVDEAGPKFIDVKGMFTAAFKKNFKLWMKYGMGDLHIIRKAGKKWTREIVSGPKIVTGPGF